jgi:hypothetical protein
LHQLYYRRCGRANFCFEPPSETHRPEAPAPGARPVSPHRRRQPVGTPSDAAGAAGGRRARRVRAVNGAGAGAVPRHLRPYFEAHLSSLAADALCSRFYSIPRPKVPLFPLEVKNESAQEHGVRQGILVGE